MERLTWVARDHNRLVYHLPKPMSDGRSELYLTPLELLDRLVSALINLTFCNHPGRNTAGYTWPLPGRPVRAFAALHLSTGQIVTAHPTQPPEIAPARGPPQWDEADINQDIYEYNFDQSISW